MITDINSIKKIPETALNGIFFTTLYGVILKANESACELLGYTEYELTQLDPPGIFMDECNTRQQEIFANVALPIPFLIKTKQKNGQYIWLKGIMTNFLGTPEIAGVVIHIDKKTTYKEAERQMLDNKTGFDAIMETTLDAIFIIAKDHAFIEINTAACEFLGYSKEALLRLGLSDIILETLPGKAQLIISSLKASKNSLTELWLKKKDGTNILVKARVKMLSEGALMLLCQKITEIQVNEASAQETSGLLECFTKATSDAIWHWNPHTQGFYLGEGFKTIFGYDLAKVKFDVNTWMNFIHPDDIEKVIKFIGELIGGTKSDWELEYRICKADGVYAFVTERGFIIRDAIGKVIRMVGLIQDVTGRKREIQQLKLLETVITNTTDAVLITEAGPFAEPGPRILYVNEAFTKMTGYTAEEVIGKTPRILQGPKTDRKELKRLGEALTKWETCEITVINYKKNGDEFWINMSISPVADEKGWFTHWISIERDVTERKNNELYETKKIQQEALLRTLHEKSIILESIGDAFFAVDKSWMVTYWNGVAETVSGKSREETVGKNFWDLFPESIDSETYKKYHHAIEHNKVLRFEDYNTELDKWHELNVYPSTEGLSVYFKDVTERKLTEIRLQELNTHLLDQSKDLAMSNDELEQFAYVASHDLQEPLRTITSFLMLLENKYQNVIDNKGKKYISLAVDGAKRMQHIVLDLLEFSRVGRIEYEKEEISLNGLMDEIMILFRKQIEETNAVVHVGSLPAITAYKVPLRQVFQNLIGNALKYSSQAKAPQIYVLVEDMESYWKFSVIDNGIGMNEEYFDKIFIIFQRLHNKDEYSGTGIGLAIAKKIIEKQGGKIWVESEEGKGSSFYFTIQK